MKIGVISDLHLGYRQYGLREREEDFYNAYNNIIIQMIEEGVDLVINCGDTFDSATPSPKAISEFSKGLFALTENNIKILNVVGNHTMLQVKNHYPADNLFMQDYDYELLDVENYFLDEDNDLFICGLPFHTHTKMDDFKEEVSMLNGKAKDFGTRFSILCIHQGVMPYCGEFVGEVDIQDLDLSNFNLILCGHIHHREVFSDKYAFVQVGSTERSNITEFNDYEENGKGYLIIEVEDDSLKVIDKDVTLLRKFLSFDVSPNDSISKLKDDIFNKVEDECVLPPVVYIKGSIDSTQYEDLIEMKKDIDSNVIFCRVKVDVISEDSFQLSEISSEDLTPEAGIQRFFEENNVEDDHKDLVLDIYNTIKYDDDTSKVHLNDVVHDYYDTHYHIDDFNDEANQYKQVVEDYKKFFNQLGESK